MTSIDSPNFEQAGSSRRHVGAGTSLRLSLGTLAILALVALAALDGRPVTQDPGFQDEPTVTFDGRGKWTGYAR